MYKYGLFFGADKAPTQVFDGDYIEQDGEFVKVFKREMGETPRKGRQVAGLRLTPSSFIREM